MTCNKSCAKITVNTGLYELIQLIMHDLSLLWSVSSAESWLEQVVNGSQFNIAYAQLFKSGVVSLEDSDNRNSCIINIQRENGR